MTSSTCQFHFFLRPLMLAVIFLLIPGTHEQSVLQSCFADFGACTQQIILPLFESSGCSCPDSGGCLCYNNNFLFAVMAGVGSCCSNGEITNTAQIIIDDCNSDQTPALISFSELQDAGNAATSSSCALTGLKTAVSTAQGTATPVSGGTPTSSGNPASTGSAGDGGRYSTSDKIALGLGIGVGLPATIAALLTLWLMCIRN